MRNRHIEDSKNVQDNLGRTFIEIIIKFSYIIQKYSYFFDVIGMIYIQNVVITCIYTKKPS